MNETNSLRFHRELGRAMQAWLTEWEDSGDYDTAQLELLRMALGTVMLFTKADARRVHTDVAADTLGPAAIAEAEAILKWGE
jgi:hypothetical protein